MLFRGDYDEKRAFARMGVECPATLRVEGEDTTYHAMATDLSASGMRISSANAVSVGTRVMVAMIPEQAIVPPLQARAEVVRCTEDESGSYQLGLKIIEMLPAL